MIQVARMVPLKLPDAMHLGIIVVALPRLSLRLGNSLHLGTCFAYLLKCDGHTGIEERRRTGRTPLSVTISFLKIR
jgi:hypothetical protein